jgi:hypothetical protein
MVFHFMIRIYAACGLKLHLGRDSRQQSTPESAASTSLRQTSSRTVMTPITVISTEDLEPIQLNDSLDYDATTFFYSINREG